ncbi:MAG: formylglycine-generating enzyme family protein [Myxococcales bacterium]|nr:formylglycine-generating enzyme family protein [Myxococcales bacterium]
MGAAVVAAAVAIGGLYWWASQSGEADFARLPGGSFSMGSPAEEPGRLPEREQQHGVTVDPFLLARTEVTQGLWTEVMGDNPVADQVEWFNGTEYEPCDTFRGASLVGPDRPVVCVSWFEAATFANALSQRDGLTPAYALGEDAEGRPTVSWNRDADGYRLPTEAEWEHAARGEERQLYPGAAGVAELCAVGNLIDGSYVERFGATEGQADCTDGHATLAPVGSLTPTGFGLHDLAGNAAEWVWDWGAPYDPEADGRNPVGPDEGEFRVVRGGPFNGLPQRARTAARDGFAPDTRSRSVGFRLARSTPGGR